MTKKEEALHCQSAWKENKDEYKKHLEDIGYIGCIVEIGVHYGYSLFTFAKDYPNAVVIGVDNFSYHDSEQAREHLTKYVGHYPNIRILEMSSEQAHKLWRQPDMYCDIDILHIDAGHEYEDVKRDYELWEPCVRPGGVIIFHDIRSFAASVGKFFDELPGRKERIENKAGLGILFKDD